MRVIAFPTRREPQVDPAVLAELEAAFDGDGTGAEAEAWRELRADVRALAPATDEDFLRSLQAQLQSRSSVSGGSRRPSRAHPGRRSLAALGALAVLAALLVGGLALRSGSGSGTAVHGSVESTPAISATNAPAARAPLRRKGPANLGRAASSAAGEAGAQSPAPLASSGEAPGESSSRLQQLGASISLGARGEGVQALADRVGQIATAAGGYVESSKVELQHGSAGEAALTLRLPAAKLAAALAQLQRLAPVRAETQELQDLTGQYDAAGGRLSAARAERGALLRALAKAETSAAIESLHQRIAQADGAIAAAEREQASISRKASEAQVDVSVVGEAQHAAGLSVGSGLSDAGHVLTVSLAVLLIALACAVPLALALALLLAAARAWRRQQRERALGSS